MKGASALRRKQWTHPLASRALRGPALVGNIDD